MIIKKNKVQARFDVPATARSYKSVSVISPVWSLRQQDPQNLNTLLQSIHQNMKPELPSGWTLETIIVANSTDVRDYLQAIQSEPWAPTKFIWAPGGAGESRGYNIGRQIAVGDLLLLTNDRIVYEKGCLTQFLQTTLAEESCVGVAPNGSCFDHERIRKHREYFEKEIFYLNGFKTQRVDAAFGVCTFMKSWFFDAVGGFRITNVSPYCSVEFSMALKLFTYNALHGTDYYYLAVPDLALKDIGRYDTAALVRTGTASNTPTPFLGVTKSMTEFTELDRRQFQEDVARWLDDLDALAAARAKPALWERLRQRLRTTAS